MMRFSIPYKVVRLLQIVLVGLREISSVDYINKLKFDYAELYSFHRGEGYDEDSHPTGYILNSKKEIHPSAIKTHTFKSSHEKMILLKEILRTEVIEIPAWMCAPVFRDAVIFYNKDGKIVSTLNVCLSCEHMELKRAKIIHADEKAYALLRQFFMDCGHRIEDR